MRLLYSLLFYCASPLVLGYLGWRGLRDRRWWSGWGQRLGLGHTTAKPGSVLVHAASVGEVTAASALIKALAQSFDVTVSTFTPTGLAHARATFGEQVQTTHAPLDFPGATRRFLSKHRPSVLLVIETEIWPNLFHAAHTANVPLMIANGSISKKSERSYRRHSSLVGQALGRVGQILAQSEEDARRFIRCGADERNVVVAGNLKFDASVDEQAVARLLDQRRKWGERPVLVAGSTHAEDEEVLFEAAKRIFKSQPECLLVLAPRHPERFELTIEAARKAGLRTGSWSNDEITAQTQCVVLDTLGLLRDFYACADVALVGGSFGSLGGHNVLEPAAHGVPVITGPDTSGIEDIMQAMLESGGATKVSDAKSLAETCCTLFDDESKRKHMGESALNIVASGRGALQRTLAACNELRQ